jgi:hypothetical protein
MLPAVLTLFILTANYVCPIDMHVVCQLFPGHGMFRGEVTLHDQCSRLYRIVYEDGDCECMNEKSLAKIVMCDGHV